MLPAKLKLRMVIIGLHFFKEFSPYEVYVQGFLKDHIDDFCTDCQGLLKSFDCAKMPFAV